MASTAPFSGFRTVGLMAGLMMGVVLTLMDQTVVSTALPTIVGQLGDLSLYAWVFSAYMLGQTSLLLIFGRLSDLYGRRRLFLLGVGAFMLGSILCGQARTMQQLVFFRGLQGIGGAGLMPTALAILGVHYGPQERARLQGILGSAAGLAVIVGPTVGSLIVEHFSWRWVFYINLPFGLFSALFVVLFLRESRQRGTAPVIDYVGALTLIGWVACLLLAFFYSRDHPWSAPPVLGLLGAFALLFLLFLVNERRTQEPILPLGIFAHPTVAAAGAVTLIGSVAIDALIIYVPLLIQGVLGGTSQDTRNALTVFAFPGILGAVVAGFLVARKIPYRLLILGGLALSGVGLWLVSQVGMATGQAELLPYLVLAGLGIGATNVTLVLALQNSVAQKYMGTASSLVQFLGNLAGTVGVGLLGTYQANLLADGVKPILASPALRQLPPRLAQLLGDPTSLARVFTDPMVAARLPPQLLAALRGVLESSLHTVFQVGLVLTAAALLVSLFMRGSAAQQPGSLASLTGGCGRSLKKTFRLRSPR